MKIEIDNDGAEINYYLGDSSNSLIYSSPRFMNLISSQIDADYGWLIAKEQDQILGILPYMKKDGALGSVYNSLAYYGSNGGVTQVIEDDGIKIKLINAFYDLAIADNAATATIISNPLLQDYSLYHNNTTYDYLDERIGQVTHFQNCDDADALINLFQEPRPRNIRKAIKEGVSVERCNSLKAIKFLHETHLNNMQTIGGLPKNKLFFEAIPETMEDTDWAIYIGEIDNKPIAALLVFYFNKTVEYFTPAIVEEYRNTQALSLVIYSTMQDALKNGFENWNWGGTWLSQKGVFDFKRKWGTTDYPYFYYTRVFNQDVIRQNKDFLLNEYSGFFVTPFSSLEN